MVGGFAWICACGSASRDAFAKRGAARRNAGRHYRAGCSAAGEAFNVLDLADAQQLSLWAQTRRSQLERAARGALTQYVRDLYPASPEARALGCPCPEGVLGGELLRLTVQASCPVHGAWARAASASRGA